ncbi:Ubiquitin carboxyl-terminal hydrolase 23 [Diplonema papillatum]|nr:Ubiquitin carboxyl-terminal hydrolase 23 [Diplonema papillatum]|eukprot:gene21529-33126_t
MNQRRRARSEQMAQMAVEQTASLAQQARYGPLLGPQPARSGLGLLGAAVTDSTPRRATRTGAVEETRRPQAAATWLDDAASSREKRRKLHTPQAPAAPASSGGKSTPRARANMHATPLFSPLQTQLRMTPRLKGFSNIGNSCYMSAVLTSVLRLQVVADAILSTARLYEAADKAAAAEAAEQQQQQQQLLPLTPPTPPVAAAPELPPAAALDFDDAGSALSTPPVASTTAPPADDTPSDRQPTDATPRTYIDITNTPTTPTTPASPVPPPPSRGRLLPFLAESVKGIASGGAVGIRPDGLKNAVTEAKASFRGNDQQDAHEFLVGLLEILHQEILDVKHAAGRPNRSKTTASRLKCRRETDDAPAALSASFVRRLAEGALKKVFSCARLGCPSLPTTVVEKFLVLSFPVREAGPLQLVPLVAQCFRNEAEIERDCPQCKGKSGVATTSLHALPHVLFLHANRFIMHVMGVDGETVVTIDKQNSKIVIPEVLDLRPLLPKTDDYDDDDVSYPAEDAVSFTSECELSCRRPLDPGLRSSTSCRYALRSVIHHLGDSHTSGHYVTDFKHSDGKWWRADDSVVTPVKTPSLASSSAYIIVFERIPA